ncbi:hypothetical protein A0J61_03044 [Choanephora cucurbitarum]|uniref:BHLH domain-containing protein n=1 Tax=Choanephora cucurbitarum TaxID=101091 RepID=A0A1C7NIV5_9FUNG|nr:hypothetical protein A0J61_03044 [Choanephora cucurbitarum]
MSCDQKHNTQHDEGAIPSSSLSPVIIDTHSLSLQIQQQQYCQQQQQLCMAPSIIPHHHLSEDVSFEENINVVPLSFNSTCSIDNLYSLSPSSSSTTTTDTSMMQTTDSQHFCSIEKEEGFMIDDNSLKKDQTQKLKSNKKRRITSDRVSSSKDIQAFNEMSNSELRRQIHIQSEQKRRAQIKDGFEELRNELPSCLNKKMSKVALLHRTVQQIQHLKNNQAIILLEVERLTHENEQLKK